MNRKIIILTLIFIILSPSFLFAQRSSAKNQVIRNVFESRANRYVLEDYNIEDSPDSDNNEIASALFLKAEKLIAKGNEKSAQKIFKKIIKKHYKTQSAAKSALLRGKYLYKKEKWELAFKALSIIRLYHPENAELDTVINLQYKCAENKMLDNEGKILGFIDKDPLHPDAIIMFLTYVKFYPFSEKTSEALLNVAKIAIVNKQDQIAINALKQIINKHQESLQIEEAYYEIASIYAGYVQGPEYDLNSTREAIRYCEDFIALFPEHNLIGKIEALKGRLMNTLANNRLYLGDYYYYTQMNSIAAIIFYNEAITFAPNSVAAKQAKNRLEAIEKGVRPFSANNFLK